MSFRQFINLMIGIGVVCVLFLTFNLINKFHPLELTDNNKINKIYPVKSALNYCGDYSAGGDNTWYSVYISYNQSDLTNIRNNFCCDAYYNKSNNTIVVASFYNKKRGSNFALFLKSKGFKGVKLGEPKIISTLRSPQKRYSCS